MTKRQNKLTKLQEDEALPISEVVEIESEPDGDDVPADLTDDDIEAGPKTFKLSEEPLFASLLRRAVAKSWPNDVVLRDYCEFVAPKLSARLGHVAAKGGDFAAQHLAAGKQGVERYGDDQSLRAHLVNGLLPVYRIAHRMKGWKASQLRRFDERAARLFVAGYTLHDWNKLPDVKHALSMLGFGDGTFSAAANLPLVERLFHEACVALGLDQFLEPIGGLQAMLHELIYIAANTQVKWGTLRNLSVFTRLQVDGPTLNLCTDLSHLSDLIAYVGRTPRDVVNHEGIRTVLNVLSEGKAMLGCHHVSEMRGVLTNLIHNAALNAIKLEDQREPILFAPSGVVYLVRTDVEAPPLLEVGVIADTAIAWLKVNCRVALERDGKGLIRGPIGIKVADFYKTYFDAPGFVKMLARQVLAKIIIDIKPSKAAERYQKITGSGKLGSSLMDGLPVDIKVDQLAEWAYACEIFTRNEDGESRVPGTLLRLLGLDDLQETFLQVPRDNRTTGGLGLHWFFIAGHYVKKHPGLDPAAWRERLDELAVALAATLNASGETTGNADENVVLRGYILETLSIVGLHAEEKSAARMGQAAFVQELANYANAKRSGRGVVLVSTLRSTNLKAGPQIETSVQFAPQIYSNKLPLGKDNFKRGIDPISATEAMLRQIFMPGMNATGKNFEGLKTRYLYLYPAYFFSSETLDVVKDVQERLRNISVTELRRQLVDGGNEAQQQPPVVRLDADTLQRLEEMLVLPPSERGGSNKRLLRMQFPNDMPVTFHFFGVIPGRDPTDAESWAIPALLALLLPLCLDVKVVASESLVPILSESDGMRETVLLDSPHAFVSDLTNTTRINIDQVQPTLARLLSAYFIHLDANSKEGGNDFYQWGRIPPVARNLMQSPLFAFAYLKKWERKDTKNNAISPSKAQIYLRYAEYFEQGEQDMTIPRELTVRYRAFYRAKRFNSNSTLRPLAIASKALLNADQHAFGDPESLVALVRGELSAFMSRVLSGSADGYSVKGQKGAERDAAIQSFAEYFVNNVFMAAFRGDRAALRGKQLNLIKNACEVIYRDLQARERAAGVVEDDQAVVTTDELAEPE